MVKLKSYLLIFLLSLLVIFARSQAVYQSNRDNSTLFPKEHGSFENHAFVLNGKVIEQKALVNYPEAILNNVFPYTIDLEGKRYAGAVYFHTEEKYAPPDQHSNEPAYFINSQQVSPYHFLWSKPELYKKIEKSEKDTVINDRVYHGSIHVDTDEDFFANRITLPELIEKHTGLSSDRVIIHWRASNFSYTSEDDLGKIISERYPLYSFSTAKYGLIGLEIDKVQFAEGEKYVLHVIDNKYQSSDLKARLLFKEPLQIDTVFPCYLTDLKLEDYAIFTRAEINPEPQGGMQVYLNNLSQNMGFPADKPSTANISDSITVQFIVHKDGMLSNLESKDVAKPSHNELLRAIKKHACVWRPAVMSGRPVYIWRKMTIYYNKDENGNMQSLDSYEFRYDIKQAQKRTL
ncbi:energy transducer TonB [Sphingobacterium hungaricum]